MPLAAFLHEAVREFPIINTHSHHREPEFFKDMRLRRLLKFSYVSWVASDFESDCDAPLNESWFEQIRFNSYFISLQKGLQSLYGISEPLSVSSWDRYDRAINEAHQDAGWHLKVLREACQYRSIIQDSYWEPGSASADPIFMPTFRINMFFYFYNMFASDHNGNNALRKYNIAEPFPALSDYLSFLYHALKERKNSCAALKCALAYDRDLAFSDEHSSDAEQCYSRLIQGNSKADDISRVQNYVFFRICEMAGELELPFQCHVGLGKLDRTRAIHLLEAIEANNSTKFVLFHGSYPYLQDIFALCHNFRNVYADLCWLPIISPAAAGRFVDEYIEVGAANTMTWGCDTWTSEESFGALLTAREVLCNVIANKIQSGYFSEADGIQFLRSVFFDNAKALYRLDV